MKTIKKSALLAAVGVTLVVSGLESCSKKSSGSRAATPDPNRRFRLFRFGRAAGARRLLASGRDVNDHKGGIAGTGNNVSFVAGIRGQAYQGSATTYASFTPSTTLQSLKSFSLSVWYWQPAQPDTVPLGIFFMADANTNPDMILENEPYDSTAGNDSLRIHDGTFFPAAKTYQGFTMETFDTAAIGKWVHECMTYDGGSSTWVVYQDGVPMKNSSAYGDLTSTQLLDGPGNATPPSTPQGNLNWTSAPPIIGTIGAWAPNTYGVSSTLGKRCNWLGKIDEIRIFNIAITQKDVVGLYLNGQAGR